MRFYYVIVFVSVLGGCASTSSGRSVEIAPVVFNDCQLVQRDLTSPMRAGGYWCKDSHFIKRNGMKHVQINNDGLLRESAPVTE